MRDFSEDSYYKDFVELQRKFLSSKNSYDKKEIEKIQKEKFKYITDLVGELFDHKNSSKAYNTISNLIVTSMTSFEDDLPADIYSGKSSQRKEEENRDVLVQEFKSQITEYKNLLSKGTVFLEVLNRFNRQYEVVNNVMFSPLLDDPDKKIPN
jgi:hypothetical protein